MIKAGIGIFIAIVIIFTFLAFSNNNKIKNGVRIEGISFSGYTRHSAEEKLKQIYDNKLKNSKLLFSYEGNVWEILYKDVAVRYATDDAVQSALSVGRGQNVISNFYSSLLTMFKGKDIQVPLSFDKNELIKRLKEIEKSVNRPAKNAIITIEEGNNIQITPEQLGVTLDINKALLLAGEHITSLKDKNIALPVNQEKPKYTREYLKVIDTEIGRSITSFNSGEANRSTNIRIATRRMNGIIIEPGQVFSLNNVIGKRNKESGYKNAPIILNDDLVPGIGGGVCQVATTLYKAVLQSGLGVVERQHHSFPPAYVPTGQDATIAGDYIDFKFKNTLDYPIFIYAVAPSNTITVKVYSKGISTNRKVKIESQILEVEDPGPDEVVQDSSLAVGVTKVERKARKGYSVAVYRNTYEGNKLVNRELISKDHFTSIRGLIKIGPDIPETDEDVILEYYPWDNEIMNGWIEEPDNPPDDQGVLDNTY